MKKKMEKSKTGNLWMKKKKPKKDAEQKKAAKLYANVATTLDWSHIDRIEDNRVYLSNGSEKAMVMGVKITPRNILIDNQSVQVNLINNLRIAFNKIHFPIYWGFIFTPVDIEDHINTLLREEMEEDDLRIKKMIHNDFEKALWFQDNYRELEFCFMLQENDEATLYKRYDELVAELNAAGFTLLQMNDNDYYNYIAYLYENPMINDFYFSRGVFSCLMEDPVVSQEIPITKYDADFEYDDFYDESEDEQFEDE